MEGLNLKFTIVRQDVNADDTIGGAQLTGTTYIMNVPGRLANSPTQELLLQQGLEVMQIWRAQFRSMEDVRERDVLVIEKPLSHYFYNEQFRVINVRYPSFLDDRKFKQLSLSRIVRSRTIQ